MINLIQNVKSNFQNLLFEKSINIYYYEFYNNKNQFL